MTKLGDFSVNKHTKYWIYTIKENSYEKLSKTFNDNEIYLYSHQFIDIKEGDIIIIYKKGKKDNGYIGVSSCLVPLIKNNNKKNFFNDSVLNKYYLEIDILSIFQTTFKIKNVLDNLNKKYYKSLPSFRSKYTIGDLNFINLENLIGKEIVTILYKLSDDYEYNVNKSKLEIQTIKEDISFKNSEISDTESIVSNSTDLSSNFNINDNLILNYKVEKQVPVLFIPCERFSWEDEYDGDFIKHFKYHFLKCKNCEINNNNDKDLGAYFKCSNIDYEIANNDDEDFTNLVESYLRCETYSSIKNIDNNTIRLYLVEDDSNIYDRTIFIEWAIKLKSYFNLEIKKLKK